MIFGALFAHKLFEAMAMGISYVKAGLSVIKDKKFEGLFFTLTTPIGIFMGMCLRHYFDDLNKERGDIISGIIMAVSSGTFVYISLIEILNEEFCDHLSSHSEVKNRIIKCCWFILGVTILGFLSIFK